mgnify:CR=1 FL=1
MNSVVDDRRHVRVQAKGSGDQPFGVGKGQGGGFDEIGDVFAPVAAGRKEVREDNNPLGTSFHTLTVGGGDVGLSQLHVSGFNDGVGRLFGEGSRRLQQHVVAGFAA